MTEKASRPNVLLLTVDALRRDRTSLYGYERPTTPNLQRLAQNALVCDTAFSLAPFTQSACVQMFTSSRPLSAGGYDSGARGHPPTVFKHFREAGYHVVGLSTLHWVNRYYGYGDGLDEEHHLFTLKTLVGVAVAAMRDALIGYREGRISPFDMFQVVEPTVNTLFRNADDYCDRRLHREEQDRRDYPSSLLVNYQHDYRLVKHVTGWHRRMYQRDSLAYVRHYLLPIPDTHEWISRHWTWCRKPARFVKEGLSRAADAFVGKIAPAAVRQWQSRYKSYVDASELADKVISLLKARKEGRPFFIWTHFMDTHMPYVSGAGKRWYRETPSYLSRLGYSGSFDPGITFSTKRPKSPEEWDEYSALYDAAVNWTDEQIGRIVDAVDQLGLKDETIIAICGDHGEELGDHGQAEHLFSFYEHNVRVPMLFRSGSISSANVGSLVSLLDLAPTLGELAGIGSAAGWEGAGVASSTAAARNHVLMETFFGGSCAFEHRPVYLGVRTHTHKYIFREWRDPRDPYGFESAELYDLRSDPGEQHNLYQPNLPLVHKFNAIARRRLAELPRIPKERLASLPGARDFPSIASDRP